MSDALQRILLIEDNPLDARLIREFLRMPLAGYGPLVWVPTLADGLRELAGQDIALVLLDLYLPDSEGLAGLIQIKSRAFAVPVITLSDFLEETLAVDAMKAGAQDFLVKGHFDEALLKRAIQYAVERQRLIHTLRTYEERYALAVQATNVGIWDWNPVTGDLFLSSRWKAILGYGDEEIDASLEWVAGKLHPDDLQLFSAEVRAHILNTAENYEVELRLRHHTGEYRWMQVMGLVARDSQRQAYRLVGTMVDITDRKRMEQALADEKERLGVTLRSIADGVIATDVHNRVQLINPVAEKLTGWKRSEAEGRPLEEVFPVLDETIASIWSAEGPAQANEVDQVRTLVHRDGSERMVEVSQSVMKDGQQKQVGAVYIIRDVTERRKAEEARAHLAAIVQSYDGAVFSKDLNGMITSWNAGAELLLGYSSAEVMGMPGQFLYTTPAKAESLELTQRVVRGGSAEYSEIGLQHKDGSTLEVALTKSLIRNPQGEVIGVSTIAHDISERKRTELELVNYRTHLEEMIQERTRELTAANRELESFCYSVSHDLRAPLRSIDGFSQALMEDYKHLLDNQGQAYIERMHAATKRMAQLIDDLLNLSRVTRSDFRPQPVNLSTLAESVVEELRQVEPGRQVEIAIEPDLVAKGDSPMLRVLLTNLLGNAWKFSSRNPQARIEFGAVEAKGQRAFRVRDNGAGFDMAYAHKLFTPFQRLHGITEFTGTGIGLAIAQRVVHRHGGEIWAEGHVNAGAEIFFTLKAEPEEVPADE